ncbi:hypothetical protein D3C80_1884450 [compost metagenome]
MNTLDCGIIFSKLALTVSRVASKPRITVSSRQIATIRRRWLKIRRSTREPESAAKSSRVGVSGIDSGGARFGSMLRLFLYVTLITARAS